ncbi:hypothetical protein [Bacillus sp. AFS040349]|uniref:hypothetical protein n=1 Tax=Bacillus sp. AFS040349 TaxID=2033502 RepID=UPI000BFD43A6|nr:hypothetical protein [Bacillus sp. AFS040349]PGT80574.1 hypothetical protein COD11_20910 [Bacillus sp. AFS040349]
MSLHIDKVSELLQEVGLKIHLKIPKSISTRWDIYTIRTLPEKALVGELRHTSGQGIKTQTSIDLLEEFTPNQVQLDVIKRIQSTN